MVPPPPVPPPSLQLIIYRFPQIYETNHSSILPWSQICMMRAVAPIWSPQEGRGRGASSTPSLTHSPLSPDRKERGCRRHEVPPCHRRLPGPGLLLQPPLVDDRGVRRALLLLQGAVLQERPLHPQGLQREAGLLRHHQEPHCVHLKEQGG